MITRVEIKNYRSIAEADVELGPMTVLVGRNGSGKSTFLDALKFVRDALRVGLENAVIDRHGFGSIRRWAPMRKRQVEIALEVKDSNFTGRYELVLGSDGDGFKVTREKASFRIERIARVVSYGTKDQKMEVDNSGGLEDQFERHGSKWIVEPGNPRNEDRTRYWKRTGRFEAPLETDVLVLPAMAVMGGFRMLQQSLGGNFYTIFPNTLLLPQKPMNDRILSDDGDNFMSVLQHITRNPKLKAEIVAVLSRVVTGVCDVRVRSAGGFLVAQLQHQDLAKEGEPGESGPWFDLSQESDGTLRTLGLLTALYQGSSARSVRGELLALEEPEIALHPGAVAILAEELRLASRRRAILVTTQSPDLIARFPAADLRVVERKDGVTHIAPLDETQRQVIEDQLFDAGELLRSEGLRGATTPKK